MELDNPGTWKWPSERPPDADCIWEIAWLKRLAIAVQERANDIKALINIDDADCVYFSANRSGKKIGEAYVNRQEANSHAPLFSIFYGREEEELHSTSIEECAGALVSSDGFPAGQS